MLITAFRYVMMKLIYRCLQMKTMDDIQLNKVLQKEIPIDPRDTEPASIIMHGLPVYYSVTGTHSALEYCPLIHEPFLEEWNEIFLCMQYAEQLLVKNVVD
jgi:hypothetical protein